MSNINQILKKNLYILDDESNPLGTNVNQVLPSSILDQIYDNQDPTNKNLRTIIEELKKMIITGGDVTINFPVTSVNGELGDVVITKDMVGLSHVDDTADNQKPLSDPQRETVMDILKDYEFNIDLKELYAHLENGNNPHHVTIDQINEDGSVDDFISDKIKEHNDSINAHQPLIDEINELANSVDGIEEVVDAKLDKVRADMNRHYEDKAAHSDIFNQKEDSFRKVPTITEENTDYDHYPSTRALVQYLAESINRYAELMKDSTIEDIVVVDTREDIPKVIRKLYAEFYLDNGELICEYNEKYGDPELIIEDDCVVLSYKGQMVDNDLAKIRFLLEDLDLWIEMPYQDDEDSGTTENANKIFFVINGVNGTLEIARYRKNPDGTYTLEYQDTHIYTHYNDSQFYYNKEDGLSVNIEDIGTSMFDNTTILNKLYKIIEDMIGGDIGENYYTKSEIDAKGFINGITIVKGTNLGTIRYYINNDISTMSDDIPVTGLGKLAFKDKLASGDLEDNCVSTDNMIGRSVTTQILADGAVDATKMNSGYKTILGNVSDPEGRTVEEIPLDYFKEVFSPYIMEVIEEKIELLASSRIKEIVDEEFKKNT